MPAKWRLTEGQPAAALLRKIPLWELGLLLAWSAYLTRDYLSHMGPGYVPSGREFGSLIASHHFWTRVQRCGLCALWNDQGGGYPAVAEAVGAPFHPLVAAATLAWGVVDGAKVTVLIALFLGGLAGWWLGRVLDLGTPARLWGGLLGAGGGYIAARMELGAVTLAFSTAACALLLPAALQLWKRPSRGTAVLFGTVLASAILSGQGYVQFAVLLTAPSYLVLALDGRKIRPAAFGLGVALALALTAFFLVPMLHFAPMMTKGSDRQFSASQPLEYVPLNLVIRDVDFYLSEALDKLPYPHMYANYLGWPAVVLAALTLRFASREHLRPMLFLALNGALGLAAVSGVLPRLITSALPEFSMVRFITAGNGVLTPPVIALSAYGLDGLLRLKWPAVALGLARGPDAQAGLYLDLRYLLLVPLVWNLWSLAQFDRTWLVAVKLGDDVPKVIDALRTPDAQWVATPFGEHYVVEPALARGLKLSPGILNFNWKDRERPLPYLEASRKGQPGGTTFEGMPTEGIALYSRPAARFAYVQTAASTVPCGAKAEGGQIEVVCSSPEEGSLYVAMNRWPGWYAWVEGEPAQLVESRWLVVRAQAGHHTYSFRYLPWDVPLGAGLTLVGTGAVMVALGRLPWPGRDPSAALSE